MVHVRTAGMIESIDESSSALHCLSCANCCRGPGTFSVFVEDIALAPANAALMYVCIIPRRGASGEDVPSEKVLIENFMFVGVVVCWWLRFATLLVVVRLVKN